MAQPPSEYDFILGGNGYMLSRPKGDTQITAGGAYAHLAGRSWHRQGLSDSAYQQKRATDVEYGALDDTIDHPEVWNDWSGGFGDFYRLTERLNAFHFAQNCDSRFPKQLIHAQAPQLLPARYASTNINVDSFVDVPLPGVANPPAGAGAVLAVGKGFVRSYVPTQYQSTIGSAFDGSYEATGGGALNFGHQPAVFGSFTFIPNTDGSGFYRRGHDGTTYTLMASQPARWFQVAAGRMWWPQFRNQLISVAITADPMATSNYSATLPIGNGFLQTEAALTIEDQLYVGFPDGVYQGNLAGTFNNVLTDVGAVVNTDNVRDLTAHNGTVIAPVGNQVYTYKPSTGANSMLAQIGPVGLGANRSAIRGRFTCVESFGRWLYGGLFTGSQSYLMGAVAASGPDVPYVWSPLQLLPHVCKISRIHVDGVSSSSGGTEIPNRLWIATDASFGAQTGATAPLYVFPIPRGDDNPVADLTFTPNYCGSARMDMGQTDWLAPSTAKVFRAVEVWADNLMSGSVYANVYYTVDNGQRTLLGQANQSPKSTLFFPALPNNFTTGQAIQLSLESFTNSPTTTPIYRAVVLRGTARPNSIEQITAKVRIADNLPNRRGGLMRPAATMLGELRGYETSPNPQMLIDPSGAASWVVVLPTSDEVEVYQYGEVNPEIEKTLTMAVLDFTVGTPIVGNQTLIVI